MATTTIQLRIEDINTRIIGHHFEIVTDDGLVINLSPGAIGELFIDLSEVWHKMNKEQVKMLNDEKELMEARSGLNIADTAKGSSIDMGS